MTHNRIERLERSLVVRRRRRGRRTATSDRPRLAAETAPQAFSADDGEAIDLLCDRPPRGYGAGAHYVDAFAAAEAVGSLASVEVDASPTIDDPTSADREGPTTTVAATGPTTAGAPADPTVASAAVDPTIAAGTAAPTRPGPSPVHDPTIDPAPPPPSVVAPDDMDGWRVTSDAADQETAFAQDIAAILAHMGGVETDPTSVPAPAPPPPAPAPAQASAPAAPQMGVGATAGHDVFDRMATAIRFDQGPVALSVDFAAMDRAIDRGETSPPPAPRVAVADVVAPPASAPAPDAANPAPDPETTPPTVPPHADVADVAAVETITAGSGPFRVATDVPLVAQVPGLSCHAAACASIVAWRDDVTPVSTDVAAATGYWERFADGRTAVYPDVLDAFGLTHTVVGPAPASALKDLIERAGPLWVAASPPGERAVVISGLTGNATSNGTMVDVVDPWAQGMTAFISPNPGSTYHQSLTELLSSIAGGAGNPVVIAQLKEGPVR